ncbi:MAG TPA: chemotaxis protein CheB, partial [Polyangiales bacterium]|nr:chemotaxis protein CheB [Polyangiales bacterium]
MSAIDIVAIGASLGGLQALQRLLHGIPAEFGCSLVLAQHRRPDPDSVLVQLLAKHCSLQVVEPEDKTPLEPNTLYVAPGDYHMLVEDGHVALSIDAPVCYARPSIDVLFESVADAYGAGAVAVMLTNSNEDGAAGACAIKRAGGKVLVQDPDTAESPVGPRSVLAMTPVDAVLDIDALAVELTRICKR